MHDHSYSSGVVLFSSLLYPLLGGTIRSLRGHSGLPKALHGAGPWTGGGTFNSGAFIYLYNDLTFSIFIYFFFLKYILVLIFYAFGFFALLIWSFNHIHAKNPFRLLSLGMVSISYLAGRQDGIETHRVHCYIWVYLFSPKYLPRGMGFSLSFHPDSK